jgi:hypothetical protein
VNEEAMKLEELTPSINLGTEDPKTLTHSHSSGACTEISLHHCKSSLMFLQQEYLRWQSLALTTDDRQMQESNIYIHTHTHKFFLLFPILFNYG